MKNVVIMISMLYAGFSFGQGALGELNGEVRDKNTNQTVYGAHVYIKDNGSVYQAKTDPGGRFRISAIPAGKYLVNIIYQGDTMKYIPATIPMDGICRLGEIKFDSKVLMLKGATASAQGRLKLIDGDLPVKQITAEDIKNSPVKFNPKEMIAAASSDIQLTGDGELVFRGARKGDMLYMMDGVKSRDVGTVPSCSIGRMMIYTGGLPAKYGDTLGGVVVMETKSYFDLYRAWEGEQIRKGNM